MQKTLLKHSDYKKIPWKNGQGFTKTIDLAPTNAQFPEDFLWRLSSAAVTQAGPFSNFPNCDRLLTVFKGDGLALNEKFLLQNQVLAFAGEENIHATLIHAPVEDLGLIYARGKIHAKMEYFEITQPQKFSCRNDVSYFFCSRGEALADDLEIGAEETLKVQGHGLVEIRPLAETPCHFVVIHVKAV